MSRKAVPLSCMFLFLLAAASCSASAVTRTFSNSSVYMEEDIIVNLTVSITSPQDTYYAIDESYPSGWAIVSTNGDTNQSGHVKWVVIQGAVNTNHSYIIRAPLNPCIHNFSGLYMFNTTYPYELPIGGSSQVMVMAKGDIDNNNCVDISDLSAIALDFGKTSGFLDPDSDINKNGSVDIFDIVVVGKEFGAGC